MSADGSADMARLATDLSRAGVTGVVKARAAMGKALADIQAGAQTRVPVDTGNLRSSISHEVQAGGGGMRGEVGPTAEYGRFVEQGTSRMRAQPYLRPATDAVVPGYEQALGQITDGIL